MFNEHQPAIGAYAASSPDTCVRVLDFVHQTIRNWFGTTGIRMTDIGQKGLDSVHLNNKVRRTAYEFVRVNKVYLHETIFSDDISVEEKLLVLTGTPGLQLAKSGFVLQLCIGKVGCLDVHNLRRFNLSENAFRLNNNVKYDTALNKARMYTDLIDKLGGTEKLWNDWCKLIADKYPKHYDSASHVSRLHVDFILNT